MHSEVEDNRRAVRSAGRAWLQCVRLPWREDASRDRLCHVQARAVLEAVADAPAARYREATENPELVALKHDAAGAVTRICELLSELDEEGGLALWRAACAKLAEFKASINDVQKAREALNELDAIFARGAGTEARWERIGKWIDTHGRLVEKERHRLKDLQLVMTAEQAAVRVRWQHDLAPVPRYAVVPGERVLDDPRHLRRLRVRPRSFPPTLVAADVRRVCCQQPFAIQRDYHRGYLPCVCGTAPANTRKERQQSQHNWATVAVHGSRSSLVGCDSL